MIFQNSNIIWNETDPQGRKVILKQATFEFHIAGADHNQSDIDFRRRIVQQARQTINSPEFIIKESSRNIYLKLIIIPYQDNLIKIKPLKVVVDADREPNEIVTWTPLNKMNGVIEKEAVIYASAETDVPNSNVR